MKKLLIILIGIIVFFSCSDEKEILFDVNPENVEVSFEPITGGAIMKYVLPKDIDIYAIQVKYKDFKNNEIVKKGTYLGNEIRLTGFVQKADNIPIEVSLINNDNQVSKSVLKYFSVNADGSFSIFDNMEVSSYWDGFKVSYESPAGSQGFLYIGYVGINPHTQKIDTLPIHTQPIREGEQSFFYTEIKEGEAEKLDVVVWTQDFRNNIVRKQVFNEVPISRTEFIESDDFEFIGSSIEDENKKIGWKFLFDGDTKGEKCFVDRGAHDYVFISEPFCLRNENSPNRNIWTVDIKEEESLAMVRIYSFLSSAVIGKFGAIEMMRDKFAFDLPSHVRIYGTNNLDAPIEECTLLGEHNESPIMPKEENWTKRAWDYINIFTIDLLEEFNAAEDNYLQINFEDTGNRYRYLKIEVLETFYENRSHGVKYRGNGRDQFYMEEFKVYRKKGSNEN